MLFNLRTILLSTQILLMQYNNNYGFSPLDITNATYQAPSIQKVTASLSLSSLFFHDHQSSAKKIQSAFKLKNTKYIIPYFSFCAKSYNCFKFFPPSTNGYKTPMPLLVYTPPRYDQIPASTSLPKIQCIQTFKLNKCLLNFIKIDKYCEQGRVP